MRARTISIAALAVAVCAPAGSSPASAVSCQQVGGGVARICDVPTEPNVCITRPEVCVGGVDFCVWDYTGTPISCLPMHWPPVCPDLTRLIGKLPGDPITLETVPTAATLVPCR
jgi:hypothetical protein